MVLEYTKDWLNFTNRYFVPIKGHLEAPIVRQRLPPTEEEEAGAQSDESDADPEGTLREVMGA